MARWERKYSRNPITRVKDISSKITQRLKKSQEEEVNSEIEEIIHGKEVPEDKDFPRAPPVYVTDPEAKELIQHGLWFAHHDLEGRNLAIQMNLPSQDRSKYKYFTQNYPIDDIKTSLDNYFQTYRSNVIIAHNTRYECIDFVVYPVPEYKKAIVNIQKLIVEAHFNAMKELFKNYREIPIGSND